MSSISGLGNSSGEIRTNYLNLLVTQLRNQNPLEPMDNNEMASQLAQLSQLEQLEGISSTFQKVFLGVQLSQARELIGKYISFVPPGEEAEFWGKVEAVEIVNGEARLRVGPYALDLSEISAIHDFAFENNSAAERLPEATALIGKEVTFATTGPGGEETELLGRVESVVISDGEILLKVGEHTVALDDVRAVTN